MPKKRSKKKASPKKKRASGPLDDALSALEDEWKLVRGKELQESPMDKKPGIYLDIPFEDYVRIPAINQSSLGQMKRSPAHYRHAPPREPSPALRFGSIVHEGHLEPHLIAQRYIVVPEETFVNTVQGERARAGQDPYKSPKSTSRYKQLCVGYLSSHPGKQQVSLDWFTKLARMLKNLQNHPTASKLFEHGTPEVTIIWDDPDTHLRCKGRIDWLSNEFGCVDLKTTEDCTEWFLDKWSYHIQAAFYMDGYRHAREALNPEQRKFWPVPRYQFQFCVVEKSEPHAVRCGPAASKAMFDGRAEYRFLLALIAECTDAHKWPGPADPDFWKCAPWFKRYNFLTAQAAMKGEYDTGIEED